LKGEPKGRGLRIAIVSSRFNEEVTSKLLQGALESLSLCNVRDEDVTVASVPGALELGLTAKALAETGKFDAIVCLGAVVKGETGHYDVVATQGTAALSRVSLDTGIPIGMGVITTNNMEQAMDRAGGKTGNKGSDAALVAVEMANLIRLIKEL
jgi:6,7-dimethyl-8-ribityllumazine synthase